MKKIILVPALLGVMGIGGFIAVTGGSLVGSASELTIDQIKEKALSEVNGTIREVELENEGSRKYYKIEVVTEDAEYDLKFDATTGELINKHKDDLDDQKQVVNNNVSVNQNNHLQDYLNENDDRDDINENDDNDEKSNTNTHQNTSNQPSPKQNMKTEQKLTSTAPAPKSVKNNDDAYDDDDRYDDDSYNDDFDDRYDDDHYEDDEDDDNNDDDVDDNDD